ncbi:iron hydrogenase small subunit [Sporomusa acidovorans]|uniref:Iron hydrogenase small subunit domain-containing protein n=1 Tax=Sporomusa acidovorans (strain ATCC 49682 / DSM 3132 / Mol) TaxID=1123286 RepID=A0ABZ3IYU3_SPOA4|nr:iron hydrogenase small subunit [Sporomusa acidovorans]OZC14185.1 periplasmic [Fe] hydrogenase small subunit precursor [Sporomusa acidovorans DSM 3132]SDE70706.1 ferredoxin hydrogenase small subunit [Sporomusa acidovorans]
MAHYDYIEKAVKVTRREFIGLAGVAAAVLWTGAYVATDLVQDRTKYIKLRAQGIYKDDAKSKIRQSHNNQAVTDVYKKFAKNPLSPLAEELFHTKYVDRTKLV